MNKSESCLAVFIDKRMAKRKKSFVYAMGRGGGVICISIGNLQTSILRLLNKRK